jgi:hypothetical protein
VSVLENAKPMDGVPQLTAEDVAARHLVSAAAVGAQIGRSDRAVQIYTKERGLRPAGWQPHPGGWRYLYSVPDVKAWLRANGMAEVQMRRARRGDAPPATTMTQEAGRAACEPGQAANTTRAASDASVQHDAASLQRLGTPSQEISPKDLLSGGTLDTVRLLYATVARLSDQLNRTPGENATAHEREKYAAAYAKMLSSVTELSDRQRDEAQSAGELVPVNVAVGVAVSCAQRMRSALSRSVQATTDAVMLQIGTHVQQDALAQVRSMVRTAVEQQFAAFMDEVAAAAQEAA